MPVEDPPGGGITGSCEPPDMGTVTNCMFPLGTAWLTRSLVVFHFHYFE